MSCPLSCYCGMVVRCGCGCNPKKDNQTSKSKRHVYVLLLGAAETGKSTMMRQMKIIHDDGMSTDSLRSYKTHVIRNVHNCIKLLLKAVSDSGLPWCSDKATNAAVVMNDLSVISWGIEAEESAGNEASMTLIPSEIQMIATTLWNDETAQKCWNSANEFNLPDSTAYFMNAIERISEESYIPTQDDVLRLRLPTKAVAVYDFTDNDWTFQITDVGGQRGERRRWIRLFDGIHAIIFLAALSEYDQFWSEEEEDGINRLELSLKLFRETVEYEGFAKATFILFLNKSDVLRQKIGTSHLDRYFPGYYGPKEDAKRASKYIHDMFLAEAGACQKSVYPHETCATDTNMIRFIFAAVRDHILWTNMHLLFELLP